MGNTYRTTISIPQELKDEMDAAGDEVNWSAVAAAAFRAKLIEVQTKWGHRMSKADVVKRLKAIQKNEREDDYEEGKRAGRQWAEREATPKELKRLAEYMENQEGWWDVESKNWLAPFGATDYFVLAMHPEYEDDRSTGDFWDNVFGEEDGRGEKRVREDDFFHGFGDGAMEIWNEVAGEL